jgi:hypothetical protein
VNHRDTEDTEQKLRANARKIYLSALRVSVLNLYLRASAPPRDHF